MSLIFLIYNLGMDENNKKQQNAFSLKGFNITSSLLAIINNSNEDDINYVLANYLLERIDILDKISIYDVIDYCYVSRSTIHRFVKSIGFESFTHMKDNIRHMRVHTRAFIDFVNQSSFHDYIMNSMIDMLTDINDTIDQQNIELLVDLIKSSRNVVILNYDTSSSSAKEFQLEMTSLGRLIKLVTNISGNTGILPALTEDDLLITCSASGNYAIATKDDVKDVKARKFLITLNHAKQFEEYYDTIIFLSDKFQSCDYISNGMQNVYTRYGINYFFDLLFNRYVQKYIIDR